MCQYRFQNVMWGLGGLHSVQFATVYTVTVIIFKFDKFGKLQYFKQEILVNLTGGK